MPRWVSSRYLIGITLMGLIVGLTYRSTRPIEPRTDLDSEAESKTAAKHASTPFTAPQKPREETARSLTLLPAVELLQDLHSPDTAAEDDLEILDALLIAYRQVLNENPSGENYELVEALTGDNGKSAAVIPSNHPSLSSSGELLDRWGQPYHFHSISSQQMEIRSAGPDGRLWSEDDVTLDDSH